MYSTYVFPRRNYVNIDACTSVGSTVVVLLIRAMREPLKGNDDSKVPALSLFNHSSGAIKFQPLLLKY